jgi:hypothetical protein
MYAIVRYCVSVSVSAVQVIYICEASEPAESKINNHFQIKRSDLGNLIKFHLELYWLYIFY